MIRQIKETCLYVKDLEKTKHFYHDLLGLPIIGMVKNRHVFFKAGTSVLLCFLPEVTKAETEIPPHYGYGKLHLAFEVDEEDYLNWKQKIENAEIKIVQEYTWKNGLHSFYFEDPDEHLLEIVPKGLWEKWD